MDEVGDNRRPSWGFRKYGRGVLGKDKGRRGDTAGQKRRVQITRRHPFGGEGPHFLDMVPAFPDDDDDES